MKRISHIGSLLKKIYRKYSAELLVQLQNRGFNDLRPSFLEILMVLAEEEGKSIKSIGELCGLKKQTMTSHLNELEKRGYILRRPSPIDKREQLVYLTAFGEKFKFNLVQVTDTLEAEFSKKIGAVELERMEVVLDHFHQEMEKTNQQHLL